ncbi:MAG: hypothetical protein ABL895_03635 [Cyclobacteriaceae bacterium]
MSENKNFLAAIATNVCGIVVLPLSFVFLQWCLSEAASCLTKLNVERR